MNGNRFSKINENDYEVSDTVVNVMLDDMEQELVTIPFNDISSKKEVNELNSVTQIQMHDSGRSKPQAFLKSFYHRKPRSFTMIIMTIFVILPLLITLAVVASRKNSNSSDDESNELDNSWNNYYASSTNAAVSTDVGTCSEIGATVLSNGGNAIDAAVASSLCLGVLSPISSGLGGGCFITLHNASTGENTFIDSREYAPSGATFDMFVQDPLEAQNGGKAIAVLGELKGLFYAWTHYGSKNVTWESLVLPSAELARKWEMSIQLESMINKGSTLKQALLDRTYPELSSLFLDTNGEIKKAGDFIYNPKLANTLENIATYGSDYIYTTSAELLAQEISDAGGIITADDIRNYEPKVYNALETDFMGYTFIGPLGSSSGGVVVSGILKFLAAFSEPLVGIGSLYYHRLVEGMKHGFAMRMHLGDPDFVNITGVVNALTSDDYMSFLASERFDDASVLDSLLKYGGEYNATSFLTDDSGTSHLSVLDHLGNAVSLTSTVNTYFGSKIVSPSTGILFNDQMDDFSIPGVSNAYGLASAPSNYPAPLKRPLSSMSPSIILKDGRVRMIAGASGGPIIITSTLQVILNHLVLGMDLLSAYKAPRVHSQFLPDQVLVEDVTLANGLHVPPKEAEASSKAYGVDEIVSLLESRGHLSVQKHDGYLAVSQSISVDPFTGVISAVADPRKDGVPAVL